MTGPDQRLREVAYFRRPSWSPWEGQRLKSFLLFFDGIAVLAGEGFKTEAIERDKVFAGPLADQGLLHVLDAATLVDDQVADALHEVVERGLEVGFDRSRDRYRESAFGWRDGASAEDWTEISTSRLGPRLTTDNPVLHLLLERGLGLRKDEQVFLLHGWVYDLIVLALQQLIRQPAERLGYALQPVEVTSSTYRLLQDVVGAARAGSELSQATVVAQDLELVAVDLESVSLDEVLAFRDEHGEAYRAYARDLRAFVRAASDLDERERAEALLDRQEALIDTAYELRRLSRKAWRRPMASFGLGIAGASVALAAGNLPGAALAAGGGLLGLKRAADPGTAYAYLYGVKGQLG